MGGAGGVDGSDVDVMLFLPALIGLAVGSDLVLCVADATFDVAATVAVVVFFVVMVTSGTATAGSEGGRRDE